MSKKTFKAPLKPHPTPEVIDQYVNDGHGRDGLSVKVEKQKNVNKENEPMSRLTIDLPESLHRRFKSLTGLAGLKMADEVRTLIENRVAELEGFHYPRN